MNHFSEIDKDITHSEKDIFDLVFFPEKFLIIDRTKLLNCSRYVGLIKFYTELKNQLNTIKITPAIKSRLDKTILLYKL